MKGQKSRPSWGRLSIIHEKVASVRTRRQKLFASAYLSWGCKANLHTAVITALVVAFIGRPRYRLVMVNG